MFYRHPTPSLAVLCCPHSLLLALADSISVCALRPSHRVRTYWLYEKVFSLDLKLTAEKFETMSGEETFFVVGKRLLEVIQSTNGFIQSSPEEVPLPYVLPY